MDHLYAPDEQGAFDDWSDFSVNMLEEEMREHHNMNLTHSTFQRGSMRQNPSSVWRNDKHVSEGPIGFELPEATGDQFTLLESMHPTASGLNVPDNTTRSLTGTTDKIYTNSNNTINKAEVKVSNGLNNVKDRIQTITSDMREKLTPSTDPATAMRMKAEKGKNKIENAADKVENKFKSTGREIKADLNKLEDKTESGLESLKNKITGLGSDISDKVGELGSKAKDELNDLREDLSEGVDKVKDKLSTQKDEPDVTILKDPIVIVEDWDKHTEKHEGFRQKLSNKIWGTKHEVSRDYHHGPSVVNGGSVKTNASLDIPPKESDSSMLDMVGKQRTKIDEYTRVNNKASGGPWPASHVPTQMRVEQSQIEDIKRYAHGGYGQADKDYYGGNENLHQTGNTNTSR